MWVSGREVRSSKRKRGEKGCEYEKEKKEKEGAASWERRKERDVGKEK